MIATVDKIVRSVSEGDGIRASAGNGLVVDQAGHGIVHVKRVDGRVRGIPGHDLSYGYRDRQDQRGRSAVSGILEAAGDADDNGGQCSCRSIRDGIC